MKPTAVLLCCLAATASALQLRPKAPQKARLRAAAPKSAATRAPEVAALAAATTLLPLAAHAEVAGWVQPLSDVLDPALFFIQFIMLLRVIISWYPETDLNDMPWRIVTWPTGQDKGDSTSLQRECSARACSGKSIHASRPVREMIARPKISRNEWKTAEI